MRSVRIVLDLCRAAMMNSRREHQRGGLHEIKQRCFFPQMLRNRAISTTQKRNPPDHAQTRSTWNAHVPRRHLLRQHRTRSSPKTPHGRCNHEKTTPPRPTSPTHRDDDTARRTRLSEQNRTTDRRKDTRGLDPPPPRKRP